MCDSGAPMCDRCANLVHFPRLFLYDRAGRASLKRSGKAQGMKRKEVRQALKEMPIEQVLLVGKSELTPKQREFARQVALGNTGADSYRKAYNSKGTPNTVGTEASLLKANPKIAQEIEAYELALEAQKYRSSESLRALVISSLVGVLVDPDAKQSTKVTAAKVLGTVTEVAAFTERKEITTVNGSDALKAQIMDQLKTLMLGSGSGQDVTDVDAVDLLAELSADSAAAPADPTVGVSPDPEHGTPPSQLHTITHEQSQNNIEAHLSHAEPTPLSSETPTPGGV